MSPIDSDLPVFDRDDALNRIPDWEFILSMLQAAVEAREFKIWFYKDALFKQDFQEMAALSHTLMGVAANLSLKAIQVAVTRLNSAAKDNDVYAMAEGIVHLKTELDRFRDLVATLE
ncbi:MAG: Hpt domain-containing protein [Candidatus Cloacimonetes bacterium]|nr:Hpt domain-containing protein [Candidatus Cloacimonadota bacterium]